MKKFIWNPWHGCHRCSPGCKNCFVFYFDNKRNIDTENITRSKSNFNLPLRKNRAGEYKIPAGSEVAVCFTSDFFINEADVWRSEAWDIIKQRDDVTFLICTKRIENFEKSIPADWNEGYDNVIIAVTCENQQKADERLPVFLNVKAKHKYIFAAPLLEDIDFSRYLRNGKIETVSLGGESYENARICNFDWVRHIKKTCDEFNVKFDYHQTGSKFLMDGKLYHIKHRDEYSQAKKGLRFLINEERNKRN